MNDETNRSRFNIVFRDCADFSRAVLDFYFPHAFGRRILPDAGVTSPRQVAFELERYAHGHAEIQLTVMEIPLVPGIHHTSRTGKSAAESMIVSGYVIPIAILNPYVAAVIIADGLVWGPLSPPPQGCAGSRAGDDDFAGWADCHFFSAVGAGPPFADGRAAIRRMIEPQEFGELPIRGAPVRLGDDEDGPRVTGITRSGAKCHCSACSRSPHSEFNRPYAQSRSRVES